MTHFLHNRAAWQHFAALSQVCAQLVAFPLVNVANIYQSTRGLAIAGHAAPSGRTLKTGGWGCILAMLGTPSLCFDVPSGQVLEFQESFYERKSDGALWARFRFVMPVIGDGLSYADVAEDFLTLCEVYVLPALEGQDMPDQIIVSLADRATEFGRANPEATQYFEAFTPDPPSCIWEGF